MTGHQAGDHKRSSFWLDWESPLWNFRSSESENQSVVVDVVVIGAGLTGASAAYHLSLLGRRTLVLEGGPVPGWGASGRNGGHFQLLPENCEGSCEGFLKERLRFIHQISSSEHSSNRCNCGACAQWAHNVACGQIRAVLALTDHNRRRMLKIIQTEQIDCDLSDQGSVYLASNASQSGGVQTDVQLLQTITPAQVWTSPSVTQELGPTFDTKFDARFVSGDGSYHPLKYLSALLMAAVRYGASLLTNVRVKRILRLPNGLLALITQDMFGEIKERVVLARSVVVATNAWTGELLPSLSQSIQPMVSQIMVTLNMPVDHTRGRTVTSGLGPVFFHQHPDENGKPTVLVMGGGPDREAPNGEALVDPPVDKKVHDLLLQLRSEFYPEARDAPVYKEWSGTMAFTKDQLPAIGLLQPGLVVAVAFNGYGGSYTTAAGEIAALLAARRPTPRWFHSTVFTPQRLLLPNFKFHKENQLTPHH
jgi:glycine/D-amino acid oxidase-like deaminating enzyme